MRIALKDCSFERCGDALIVVCDPSKQVELGDPEGHAEALLGALAVRPQTLTELRRTLAGCGVEVDPGELRDAVRMLDSLRLLEDADDRAGAPGGRYFANRVFFDLFASLDTGTREYQRRLDAAHVLQLGTGGLGSNVVQCLSGLGVGRLTLLDHDIVEPRNFARQYLYRQADIGDSKVRRAANWVRDFDPHIEIAAVERRVTSAADLDDLLGGVDLVVSGIDQPDGIDGWVNEACVRAGVPWIRGGMLGTQLVYYSVDPGRSPCLACWQADLDREVAVPGAASVAIRLGETRPRINRGIGPAAALIGSLVGFEALRYLTRYEEPYAAGARVYLETSDGCRQWREPWPADPDCALCAAAGQRTQAVS